MFDGSLRYLATAAKRTSPHFVVALLACLLLVLAWRGPTGHVEAAMQHPVPKGGAASVTPDSRLDSLRKEAASGDERANLELSSALMDRFDLAGDSDDLYEALEWVDRRWDVSDHAEQVGRVVAHYCGHRVVQWHRLCVLGE
ncbi:hypothetical protein [Variovorax ginsengisoli]|uniref:Uncharacterized protein n=1 Tax=Variovorax ginsengisoli TaxID=363844 RepID=A0ABT8SGN8_9BURK|nr:hypothetical protein [Variovorax ginsengisoli]MDN8618911.1 hypothetical protein [Variovorax ginsengisoli]MDO1538081.1 hypothetical protein [Variovorax ginsengisoli]